VTPSSAPMGRSLTLVVTVMWPQALVYIVSPSVAMQPSCPLPFLLQLTGAFGEPPGCTAILAHTRGAAKAATCIHKAASIS